MGNQFPQLRHNNHINPYLHSLAPESFIIKTLLTHSPEHHTQLVNLIAKFKQFQCPHLLRLVDSHSVQAYSLCSVVSQVYLFIEKPTYTLSSYLRKQQQTSPGLNAQQFISILLGCSRAIAYLLKEGIEVNSINENCIFVDQNQQGHFTVKILPPLFGDQEWEQNKIIDTQVSNIAIRYLNQSIPQEIREVVSKLSQGEIVLSELEERLGESKRSKVGLKLTKDISHKTNTKKDSARLGKPSRQSLVSNTSSLMIDSGDFSDLMFRQFYQNFDDSISEIPPDTLNYASHQILCDETNHAFPKKYLRGKAFRRSHKSEWPQFESSRGWSDWKSEGQNLTRDESGKENIGLCIKPSMFESARLAESSMEDPLL